MDWTDIQNRWPEIKRALAKENPDLDPDELERTSEGRTQLLQLIDAKYGAAQPKAEGEVDEVVSSAGEPAARREE